MHPPWNAEAAAQCDGELALRAYSSRLLGSDPSLVLLGGGNTSVKLRNGNGEELLYVKGTGVDLAHVVERDFTPLKLVPVREILRRNDLDYASMMRELAAYVAAPAAPKPSIETLLHAALPARYVEHTHADAVLAIANTGSGMALAQRVFGDLALIVPYRHSGFALAKICAEAWAAHAGPGTIGMILMHHGAVACGATARESYENMLRLVDRAEDYLAEHQALALPAAEPAALDAAGAHAMALLRRDISRAAGYPLVLTRSTDPVATAFALGSAARVSELQSPATPQHAVFARRLPMVGRDVASFARAYAAYLRLLPDGPRRLDAAPRIVLDPELGMLAAGITPWHMDAAATSYCHTIATMLRANAHDRYVGLPPENVLEAELEYGGLERRIAADRIPEVAHAGSVSLLAPSLGALLEPLTDALLAGSGAVAVLGERTAAGATRPGLLALGSVDFGNAEATLTEVIGRFGGIDYLICTRADRQLVEQALPWLSLSPATARVVLTDTGEAGASDGRGFQERCRASGVAVVAIRAGAGPSLVAQEIARALAIPSAHSLPKFAAHE